jgi:hypothetical protein
MNAVETIVVASANSLATSADAADVLCSISLG